MIEFIAIFLEGYSELKPDIIIAVDKSYQDKLEKLIHKYSDEFDSKFKGDVHSKEEYIIEQLEDFPCEIVTNVMNKIYL